MTRFPKSRHPIAGSSVARVSVSLSVEDKEALEKIAFSNRVSLAWVLRDAVSQYLSGKRNEAASS